MYSQQVEISLSLVSTKLPFEIFFGLKMAFHIIHRSGTSLGTYYNGSFALLYLSKEPSSCIVMPTYMFMWYYRWWLGVIMSR